MWPSSLRARLLWLLFAAVAVTAAVQSSIAYRTAMSEANEIFHYHMQQTAMSLRTGLPRDEWQHPGRLPSSEQDDDFIVQVWNAEGLLVFRSIDQPILPQRAVLGFSEAAKAPSGNYFYNFPRRLRGCFLSPIGSVGAMA